VPDRLSKSQIDKLGERLRDSAEVSEEDLALLQLVRAEHDAAMQVVAERVAADLDLEPGTRLKVIITVDGRNVEVQVRTELQHLWAQVFERFADRYGRSVRYGLPPDDPAAVVPGYKSAEVFVKVWQNMSVLVRESEDLERDLMAAGRPPGVQEKFEELQARTVKMLHDALKELSVGESSE
jgi:hypothetical protein